jgi:hypothetical protein
MMRSGVLGLSLRIVFSSSFARSLARWRARARALSIARSLSISLPLPLSPSPSLSVLPHAYTHTTTDWGTTNLLADEFSSTWLPVERRFPALKAASDGPEEARYFVRSGVIQHFSKDQAQTNAAVQFVNCTDDGREVMRRWHQVA